MTSMARQESSVEQRNLAHASLNAGPAIVAFVGDETSVGCIAYVAKRSGLDTEECIRKAVDAGKMELVYKSDNRDFDRYRLTARGRELYRMHKRYLHMIGRMGL